MYLSHYLWTRVVIFLTIPKTSLESETSLRQFLERQNTSTRHECSEEYSHDCCEHSQARCLVNHYTHLLLHCGTTFTSASYSTVAAAAAVRFTGCCRSARCACAAVFNISSALPPWSCDSTWAPFTQCLQASARCTQCAGLASTAEPLLTKYPPYPFSPPLRSLQVCWDLTTDKFIWGFTPSPFQATLWRL